MTVGRSAECITAEYIIDALTAPVVRDVRVNGEVFTITYTPEGIELYPPGYEAALRSLMRQNPIAPVARGELYVCGR